MNLPNNTPLKYMSPEELQEELDYRTHEDISFWGPDGHAIRERIESIYRMADKRGITLA